MIKQRVENSKVIGTDETGIKVKGNKHWFWTWQTPNLTFIAHSNNRGSDTIDREFPQGFPQSTLVHDGWKAQLKTISKNHQSCLAHLQLTLNYLKERYLKNIWTEKFIKLLYDSLALKKKWNFQSKELLIERAAIVQRMKHLLSQFQVEQTAHNFAKIRSVIDTAIKNGLIALRALVIVAEFEFEL